MSESAGGAEARHEVGAARCVEAGAGRSAADEAGDQSGYRRVKIVEPVAQGFELRARF